MKITPRIIFLFFRFRKNGDTLYLVVRAQTGHKMCTSHNENHYTSTQQLCQDIGEKIFGTEEYHKILFFLRGKERLRQPGDGLFYIHFYYNNDAAAVRRRLPCGQLCAFSASLPALPAEAVSGGKSVFRSVHTQDPAFFLPTDLCISEKKQRGFGEKNKED